jgi:hypothetical protein
MVYKRVGPTGYEWVKRRKKEYFKDACRFIKLNKIEGAEVFKVDKLITSEFLRERGCII